VAVGAGVGASSETASLPSLPPAPGGGGSDPGGTGESPISASVGIGNPAGGGSLIDASASVENPGTGDPQNLVNSVVQTATSVVEGLTGGGSGNLLDVDASANPQDTSDPVDTSATANTGGSTTSVNDDSLLGNLTGAVGGLLN
jgi:hypothetical protein